jgi:hypothetical protein
MTKQALIEKLVAKNLKAGVLCAKCVKCVKCAS